MIPHIKTHQKLNVKFEREGKNRRLENKTPMLQLSQKFHATSNTWLYILSIKIQESQWSQWRFRDHTTRNKIGKTGSKYDRVSLLLSPSESRFRARIRDTRRRNSERSTYKVCLCFCLCIVFLETGYIVPSVRSRRKEIQEWKI